MRLMSPFPATRQCGARSVAEMVPADRYFDLIRGQNQQNGGTSGFLFLSVALFLSGELRNVRVWLARLLNCHVPADPVLWFASSPSSAFTRRHLNTLETH